MAVRYNEGETHDMRLYTLDSKKRCHVKTIKH